MAFEVFHDQFYVIECNVNLAGTFFKWKRSEYQFFMFNFSFLTYSPGVGFILTFNYYTYWIITIIIIIVIFDWMLFMIFSHS